MCFKFIKKIAHGIGDFFGGSSGTDSATQAALEAARQAAETAAQSDESDQQAQESRLRKLAAQRGQGKSFTGADLNKAPTAVRMLFGQ